MRKFLLNFSALFLCVFGTLSCSRLDVAVNWADTYIVSQIDDYFDLTSQQSKALKESLKQDIHKIRQEQFTVWAADLRRLKKNLLEDKPRGENFQKDFHSYFHSYFVKALGTPQKLRPYFADTAVKFISTVSPAQLKYFEKAVRKKHIEDQKKIQDSEKARNESRKKYLRGIEMWIGSLSKEQTQLLNQHLNQYPFPLQAQMNNKIFILEKFRQSQKSPEDLKNFVRNLYNNKYETDSLPYRQALASYQIELEKFTLQLLKSLSEKQKKLFAENLSEKSSSLEKLSVND